MRRFTAIPLGALVVGAMLLSAAGLKREKTMNRIALGVIVAVMAISTSVSAEWGRNSCAPTVQRTLSDAGIASSDIADTTYVRERSSNNEHTVGYTAWIRMNSCRSGYVVINLTTECWVEQTYTFGACRVNGIKQC